MTVQLHHGDCRAIIATLPDCSVDSIVTDPPYELGFMGKRWDASGVAYDVTLWAECLRVLKPGGHLLAFGGTRTYHRMTVAIEDAGFEIRDSIHWLYGSGFPKSLDVSKAIRKAAGAEREVVGKHANPAASIYSQGIVQLDKEVDITAPATDVARQWSGWGTALKPAHEPIVVARKPLSGTVAANVLQHGTGALNIDGTRIAATDSFGGGARGSSGFASGYDGDGWTPGSDLGRWPANMTIDELIAERHPDWAIYFFTSKASERERTCDGTVNNRHPSVKPLALMRWLVRLVTPPGGTVLEPFAGSGTTLAACVLEGFHAIGCEMTAEYLPIIEGRVAWAEAQTGPPPDTTTNNPTDQPTLFGDTTA